jgi:ABC-type branched-subunit amino acid transport system ATPase component
MIGRADGAAEAAFARRAVAWARAADVADIFAVLKRINAEQGTTMLIVEQNAHVALKHTSFAYILRRPRRASGESAALRKDEQIKESYLGVHA